MNHHLGIGIDFGGTSIKAGVVLADEVVYTAPAIKTGHEAYPETVVPQLVELIKELQKQFPEIRSVGIGVPGFVDFDQGFIYDLPNVKGWASYPLKEQLATGLACSLPIAIENDANAMAYAEWKRGAGRGFDHLIALTMGTGVGAGLVLNGQLHRGSSGVAGEIGQSSIHYEGRVGSYGNRGMLEAYIGHQKIAERAHALYKEAGKEPIEDLAWLSESARQGDPIALAVWDEVARQLSCSLMNVCYLLNPEIIIIGGGVSQAGSILFDPLQKHLKSQLSPILKEHLQIVPARYGNNAGIIGSAVLGLEQADLLSE